jgi:acetyl-CoA carboxylase biotin carboxyl carrier protein
MTNKTIKSPVPGTFYRRPEPGADPYVAEGDDLKPGDVVGIVEIMKNFFEIQAEEAGTVDRFLVQNEEAVEAGQDIVALRD